MLIHFLYAKTINTGHTVQIEFHNKTYYAIQLCTFFNGYAIKILEDSKVVIKSAHIAYLFLFIEKLLAQLIRQKLKYGWKLRATA